MRIIALKNNNDIRTTSTSRVDATSPSFYRLRYIVYVMIYVSSANFVKRGKIFVK